MLDELVVGRVYQVLLDEWPIGLPLEVVTLPGNSAGKTGAVLRTPLGIPLAMGFGSGKVVSSRYFIIDRPMGMKRFAGFPMPVEFAHLPDVPPSGDPGDPNPYKVVCTATVLGELERPA
jgi:hypothetical protein